MEILIKNIKGLVQTENVPVKYKSGDSMAEIGILNDAWLRIKNGHISSFGEMRTCPENINDAEIIDASGRFVFPSFCDSHTHIVYAGSREIEYTDKIRGLTYEEIAKRGGGILNSARLLQKTPEDELFEQSMVRINEIISLGTGAVEIKSGYGLTTESELKMLRVIRRIKESTPLTVKSTFLGAHSVPEEYRTDQSKYVDIVVNEMIPAVAAEKLADFIDVFCDKGFFTVEETERILDAGIKYGLRPKIHANELAYSGGIQAGTRYKALSVDHLEFTGKDEIEALKNSDTMPTLLPGASFFLSMDDPPARKMIESGLPLALASDYNPGSSPSGDMKFIMSLACIKLRLLPEEAMNAATINGAYAMGISDTHGSICIGKVANIYITKKIPSYEFMPYAYGSKLVDAVILNGIIIETENDKIDLLSMQSKIKQFND